MKTDLEDTLFSVTLNPLLKLIISHVDVNCPLDGNLILNSLRCFLGEPVSLCPACQRLSANVISPIYDIGSKVVHSNREFMPDIGCVHNKPIWESVVKSQ